MVFSTQSFHYYVRTSSLFLFASMFLILHLYRKKFRFSVTVVKPSCSLKSLNESVITEKRARFEQVPFKLYDDTICCLNSTKTFLLCMSSPHPATRYFVCRAAGTFSPEAPKLHHYSLPKPANLYYEYPYNSQNPTETYKCYFSNEF